jgi:phosphonatase-like hydrolase
MIELVVFDMSGTTVQDGDAVSAAFRAALAAVGVDADPAAVNAVMGLPKPEALRILLAGAGRSCTAEEIGAIHEDFVRRMREHYAIAPSVREMPGTAAVFAGLRRAGVKVALNTGFSRAVADVLLGRLGWRAPEVIEADVTSDEAPRGRPHPDMIRLLMSRLGVHDPRRVAKVGDTKADLEEGTRAGCGLVIGVTTGSFTREQLVAFPHTHIVESVADVPAIVLSVGQSGTSSGPTSE